jgi:NitT/TauT family transport system permease protein
MIRAGRGLGLKAEHVVIGDDLAASDIPAQRRRFGFGEKFGTVAAPAILGVVLVVLWEVLVRVEQVPPYVLPAPSVIAVALVRDWGMLSISLLTTLAITLQALALAVVLGLAFAVLFAQSTWMERAFFPYAVVLQVTPIVAIAPLIIIWANNTTVALLICAWLVAFFPILSNTTVGLNSADHTLVDLFQLYRANRWQTLRFLRLPAAMPYFFAGLRISGGLALIGAVVAEFVAGSGGTKSGLAFRILEAGNQLNIPRMFAALVLISLCGMGIFLGLTWMSHLALRRWHESAVRRESS